jgi:hypothetical protein
LSPADGLPHTGIALGERIGVGIGLDLLKNFTVKTVRVFAFGFEGSGKAGVEWDVGSNPGMVPNFVDADTVVGIDLQHPANEVCGQGIDTLWDGVAAG